MCFVLIVCYGDTTIILLVILVSSMVATDIGMIRRDIESNMFQTEVGSECATQASSFRLRCVRMVGPILQLKTQYPTRTMYPLSQYTPYWQFAANIVAMIAAQVCCSGALGSFT